MSGMKKSSGSWAHRFAVGAGVVCITAAAVYLRPVSAGTEVSTVKAIRPEPIPCVIQTQKPIIQTQELKSIHILEETDQEAQIEVRTYKDVPFVALPVPMSDDDQFTVFTICQNYDVAFPLVMALIEHESQFEQTARSASGDSGYMQINDCNLQAFEDMGFDDIYDLEQNVTMGVSMLRYLFDRYPGDTTFVLMAYNAGEKGAQQMKDRGITETDYSVEIMGQAEVFSSYIDDILD